MLKTPKNLQRITSAVAALIQGLYLNTRRRPATLRTRTLAKSQCFTILDIGCCLNVIYKQNWTYLCSERGFNFFRILCNGQTTFFGDRDNCKK